MHRGVPEVDAELDARARGDGLGVAFPRDRELEAARVGGDDAVVGLVDGDLLAELQAPRPTRWPPGAAPP